MHNLIFEKITKVHHWSKSLFSFKTTKEIDFNFQNGQFTMIGFRTDRSFLFRAYSTVSSSHESHLEFLSVKIAKGKLTSILQHIKKNDFILINKKFVGNLLINNLYKGRNLYLISTGTGIAPFISIIKDTKTYKKFTNIILIHCVRFIKDLCYEKYIKNNIYKKNFFFEYIKKNFIYYPIVTRENFQNYKYIKKFIIYKKFFKNFNLYNLDPKFDRIMICGSPKILKDLYILFLNIGFNEFSKLINKNNILLEKSFVR